MLGKVHAREWHAYGLKLKDDAKPNDAATMKRLLLLQCWKGKGEWAKVNQHLAMHHEGWMVNKKNSSNLSPKGNTISTHTIWYERNKK
jgi:hypothetical protein